jgi:hypothetical protein
VDAVQEAAGARRRPVSRTQRVTLDIASCKAYTTGSNAKDAAAKAAAGWKVGGRSWRRCGDVRFSERRSLKIEYDVCLSRNEILVQLAYWRQRRNAGSNKIPLTRSKDLRQGIKHLISL